MASGKLPRSTTNHSAIKLLLDASSSILVVYPHHFLLPHRLLRLVGSFEELHDLKLSSWHGPLTFVTRRIRSREVSRLAAEAESNLKALIEVAHDGHLQWRRGFPIWWVVGVLRLIAAPDSSGVAALSYAEKTGVPFQQGLV